MITLDDYIFGTYDPNAPFNRKEAEAEFVKCDCCGELFEADELYNDNGWLWCDACIVEMALQERGSE
jgi:formylmethanofuran dehydrogenase subunit E